MAFVTFADLKVALRIPVGTTKFDAELTAAADAANDVLLRWFGLDRTYPSFYTLTARLDPVKATELVGFWADVRPLIAISEVRVDGGVVPADSYYFQDVGTIRFNTDRPPFRRWSGATNRVEFDVTAGFATVPGGLKQAGVALGVMYRNEVASPNFKSEQAGRYRYERFAPEDLARLGFLPPVALLALRSWRQIVLVDSIARREGNAPSVPIDDSHPDHPDYVAPTP